MIFRIALRYLFARKSHKVVNVISFISIAGVAVATAAIVIVLSVFNGFTGLATSHLSLIDPDIKAVRTDVKSFTGADSLAAMLESIPQIETAMPVLQERALLITPQTQKPVIVKGVEPQRYPGIVNIDRLLIDGVFEPRNGLEDSITGIQASVGVAVGTGLRPSPYQAADLYMPRRTGRINPANPSTAYRRLPVALTGVFRVDQPEYDADYVLAPIDDVRKLLEYDTDAASWLEIKAAPGYSIKDVEKTVADALPAFEILGRDRQQAETFRMIAVEKWVTFLMLVFILIIASFNIVSTLSLMVIEKRSDMSTLRALGATRKSVRSVFVAEGWLITASGGIAGTILGSILVMLQQHFGFIKIGGDPQAMSVDVYPVELHSSDLLLVIATVAIVGLLIGYISRIFTSKIA